MCGIVGWVSFDGRKPPRRETIVTMARAIAHRGPDDEGLFLADHTALAARRLSIIDLAGGHQPIGNEDGSVWVTFNGEIYNHNDLRAELITRGHRFQTRCDTEVLVHLYEEHGPDLLSKLEGQFAFGIWDDRRKRLFAARDRIGVRPFFYHRKNGLLLFASEIKALLASGELSARLDPCGLDHFCHFMFLIHERTMFAGVKALPPGHFLLADEAGLAVRPWWDLRFPPAGEDYVPSATQTAKLTDEYEARLQTAVERRLWADVPVAAYLSGGVDSALITALINEKLPEGVPTFTATFRQRVLNEAANVQYYNQAMGTRPTYVDCRNDVLAGAFPQVVYHAEAPVMDTASAATFELARAVRKAGYKIVLSGEGADEAMAGYVQFKLHKLRLAAEGPFRWFKPLLAVVSTPFFGPGFIIPPDDQVKLAKEIFGFVPSRWGEFWFLRQLRGLLSADVRSDLGDFEAWQDVPDSWRCAVEGRHPLNQALYLGYRMRLAGSLLSEKGDRMSMAHSVEGRYPFLDTELVDFSARLPTCLKLKGLQEKYLLRRVAARHIPAKSAWAKKKMFIGPYSETFLHAKGGLGRELLQPEAIRRAGIFDPAKVSDLLQAAERIVPKTPAGVFLEMAVVLVAGVQLWHHAFVEGNHR